MDDKLIEKITKVLSSHLNTQMSIVYLMVNIRKLIYTKHLNEDFLILKHYCDWLLHVEMTHRSTKELLKNIKDEIESTGSFMKSLTATKLITFVGLQNDLLKIFKKFNINNSLDDENTWSIFIKNLSLELIDTQLTNGKSSFVIIGVSNENINSVYIGENGIPLNVGFYIPTL